jgi:hypothetical protein
MSTARTRAWPALGLALGFLALTAFLWPVTRTWYLGDDAYVAFYADAVALRGDSVAEFILSEVRRMAEQLGRFAPLGLFLFYGAYVLVPSVFAYKVAVLAVAALSVALAVVLLRQLGLPWPYASLVPVSLCAVIQLRYWHDPLLAYAALMPTVACLTLGSLVALAAALRRHSLPLYGVALVLFAADCLLWEGSVFFAPLVLLVAWAVDGGRLGALVRRTAPFAVPAVLMLTAILVLRAAAPDEGAYAELYQPKLSLGGIASGVAKHVSGAVPLGYLAAVAREPDVEGVEFPKNAASAYGAAQASQDVPPGFVGSESALVLDALGEPRTALLVTLVAVALAVALAAAARTPVSTRAIVAASAMGVGLVIGSALGPAVSTRWQTQTFFGVPYISVFVAYLGVAVLLVSLLAAGFRAARASRAALAAGGLAFAAAIVCAAVATNALNERVVEAFGGVKTAMVFNERAVDAGLLRAADRSEVLLLDQSIPLTGEFLSVADGRPIERAFSLADVDRFYAECSEAPKRCPRIASPVAYLSRLDDHGMPWAGVCRVDVRVARRVDGVACRGSMAVAVGGDQFPTQRCDRLLIDASYVPGARTSAPLPARLVPIRRFGAVRFCLAEFDAPVFARSIVVAATRSPAEGPLRIVATYPAETRAGVPFNLQPTGESAMAIDAVGATPTTRVVMNGIDVPSHYVNPRLVTAGVPEKFFARPGRVEIRLRDRGVTSPPVHLVVRR